jgi:Mrp family chromosome partitioning ATPase
VNYAPETETNEEQLAAASMPPGLYGALSTLAQRVYATDGDRTVRTVMVTAARPQSGVSYISSCLSTLVAEVFGKCVLVDGQVVADLARKGQLPSRSDCTSIKHSRLWVLGTAEGAEISAQARGKKAPVRAILDSLLGDFEYVVVDTPALSESKAAEALSPEVDGVILVVVPNETDIEDISTARIKLTSRGGHLLGAIYNTSLDPSESG